MRQQHNRESDLSRVCSDITPDTPEVAGPWNSERMDQETRSDVQIDGKAMVITTKRLQRSGDRERQSKPPEAIRTSKALRDYVANYREFPTRDQRERISHSATIRIRNLGKQPAGNLPVATSPTMLPHGVRLVRGRVFIE